MPKLDLTFTAGALSAQAKRELPGQLAATLLRWEGAPDTAFFRSVSWTHVHELPADAVHTADGPAELSQFVINVTVPQGALSDRRRAGLVEDATKLVREAAGLAEDETMRIWILIQEIDEGSWGAGGQIIRFEELRAVAKEQREQAGSPA